MIRGTGIGLFIYWTTAEWPARFADVGKWLEIRKAFEKIASTSVAREKALYAAGSRHDVDERIDAAAENLSGSKAAAGKSSMYFGNFLDTRTDTRMAQASSALEMKLEEV